VTCDNESGSGFADLAPGRLGSVTGRTRDALELPLERNLGAPALARHALVEAFADLGTPARQQSELVASELVTNAILHGRGPVVFRAGRRGDRLRIEVDDGSSLMGPPTDGSRGLELIAHVASAWGVQRHEPGKTVWAEVPLH
jgi:hypothetical protein